MLYTESEEPPVTQAEQPRFASRPEDSQRGIGLPVGQTYVDGKNHPQEANKYPTREAMPTSMPRIAHS